MHMVAGDLPNLGLQETRSACRPCLCPTTSVPPCLPGGAAGLRTWPLLPAPAPAGSQVGQVPGWLMQDLAQQSAAQYQTLSCSGELETPKLSCLQVMLQMACFHCHGNTYASPQSPLSTRGESKGACLPLRSPAPWDPAATVFASKPHCEPPKGMGNDPGAARWPSPQRPPAGSASSPRPTAPLLGHSPLCTVPSGSIKGTGWSWRPHSSPATPFTRGVTLGKPLNSSEARDLEKCRGH